MFGADPLGQGFSAQVDREDFLAVRLIGQGNLDDGVEAAGPQQGRVQQVQAVGGPQHQDPLQFLDAVQLGQELAEDPLRDMGIGAALAPGRDQGVDLVEEDDAGRRLPGS